MCVLCVCVCCSILNTFLKEYSVIVPLMPVQYPSYDVLLCLILVQRADVMLPPLIYYSRLLNISVFAEKMFTFQLDQIEK